MPPTVDIESRLQAAIGAHGEAVYRYAAAQVGRQLADDVTAETFAVAWSNRARFDDPCDEALEAWLIGIAKVLVAAHRRREGHWTRIHTDAAAQRSITPLDGDEVAEAIERLDATRRTRRAGLQQLLEAVPPREREPLLLHVLHDHSYDEIAARLGVPVGTVRSRISRGRRRLRALLLLAMVLVLLLLAAAVSAGPGFLRAVFGGDPERAANRVAALHGPHAAPRLELAVFEAPLDEGDHSRHAVQWLLHGVESMPAWGRPVESELRTLVEGEVTVIGVPTTTGYLCYTAISRSVSGGACVDEFTDDMPADIGVTSGRDYRIVAGLLADDVTGATILFADGREELAPIGANGFGWRGPKSAVAVRFTLRDGSTRTWPLNRTGRRRG